MRRLLRHIFCAIDGHQPQLDRIDWEFEDSHYLHPCWCGEYLGEHIVCDCAKKWARQVAAERASQGSRSPEEGT